MENYNKQFKHISNANLSAYLKQVNLESLDALFDEIGHGERSAAMVATGLLQYNESHSPVLSESDQDAPMAIEGSEGMALQYAKCCYPIPGDSICGVIVKGKGVMVHRAKCPKIMNKINS